MLVSSTGDSCHRHIGFRLEKEKEKIQRDLGRRIRNRRKEYLPYLTCIRYNVT